MKHVLAKLVLVGTGSGEWGSVFKERKYQAKPSRFGN